MLMKFADYTKLEDILKTRKGWNFHIKEIDNNEDWSNGNKMKFKNTKCKDIYLWINKIFTYKVTEEKSEEGKHLVK